MPNSIKRELIVKQNNSEISLEYTNTRLEGYKTILKLWNDSDDQIALTQIINALNLRISNPVPIMINNQHLLKKLGKTGLFSYSEIPTGIFSSNLNFEILDKEFINSIFYLNENSQVLHLATMFLAEAKMQNDNEKRIITEVQLQPSFCNIV